MFHVKHSQGVEKGFSTPCKCKSAKAVLHLEHHFLVKWVSKIPHFTARAPSFSEAEGAATLRLPPETRDPPQRGRGAIKKIIEEAVVPTAPRTGKAGSADKKMKGWPPFIASRKFVRYFFDSLVLRGQRRPSLPQPQSARRFAAASAACFG